MTEKCRQYLDSLSDDDLIFLLNIKFGAKLPQWERCSKREFEKYCGKTDEHIITPESLERFVDNVLNGREYRAVPFWNEEGGIMDQISGREPDGYHYEKCIGYKKVLMLGSDMIEYCQTRECMKPYLNKLINL